MEPWFEFSTKRKPLLVLNNCKYTHYRKNKDEVSYWRCVQYHKGCRAQIKTFNSKIVNNATPIHNHGLTSSTTTSRARPDLTTTPKTETNLNRKIAILQKLLDAKSANSKAFNRNSSKEISSKDSFNKDESDSCEHLSIKDESDSSKQSSNEDDSFSSKHSSNEDESDSDTQSFSKKKQNRPYNKNKKPIKWVKY